MTNTWDSIQSLDDPSWYGEHPDLTEDEITEARPTDFQEGFDNGYAVGYRDAMKTFEETHDCEGNQS